MSKVNQGEFKFIYSLVIAAIFSWFWIEPNSVGSYFRFILSIIIVSFVIWQIIRFLTK
jgi:hypothetical protein